MSMQMQMQMATEPAEEVYGYSIRCEFRASDGTVETKIFRSKGKSKRKAERTPIYKRGFLRIVELDPYTREQWLRVFGEGRI